MTIAAVMLMFPADAVVPPIGIAVLRVIAMPTAMAVPAVWAVPAAVHPGVLPVSIAEGMVAGAGLRIMRPLRRRRQIFVLAALACLLGRLFRFLGCLDLLLCQLLCQLLLLQCLHLREQMCKVHGLVGSTA